VSITTIEELQKIVADNSRSERERRQAAEHIINLQRDYAARWSAIPDNDPDVLSLTEKLEGQEYLQYWPEYKNRTLGEAKEIVYLRRVSRDTSRHHQERSEAENALMTIRRKLRGDT
jgi:glutamyl-tRNA reductase